jgi:deazaflavin-dependent oxidoreductase (nitroreductase family)
MSDADNLDFNARDIAEFRDSGGLLGGRYEGAPVLLLTTIGAKSGRARTSPVMYLPDGDRLIVFARDAGAERHPAWLHNLRARPSAMVEVGGETVHVRAVEIEGAEHDRLCAEQARRHPGLAADQAGSNRVVPVMALTRSGE